MRIVIIFVVSLIVFTATYGAQVELLENPGFEDGILDPWMSNGWVIDTDDPHSGAYYVFSGEPGSRYIEQGFEPINVDDIISITFWQKYGGTAFSGGRLYYSSGNYDYFYVFIQVGGWAQFDITDELRSTGDLVSISIYDYHSVPPADAYLDDVSIVYENYVGIESTSFGSIKAALK